MEETRHLKPNKNNHKTLQTEMGNKKNGEKIMKRQSTTQITYLKEITHKTAPIYNHDN